MANRGPRGTSIPPPMSPVAMASITERISGLWVMTLSPSRISRPAWPKSRPLRPPSSVSGSTFRRCGSTSVEMSTADRKNVKTSK